jgi:hypothetical protein
MIVVLTEVAVILLEASPLASSSGRPCSWASRSIGFYPLVVPHYLYTQLGAYTYC